MEVLSPSFAKPCGGIVSCLSASGGLELHTVVYAGGNGFPKPGGGLSLTRVPLGALIYTFQSMLVGQGYDFGSQLSFCFGSEIDRL